MSLFIRCQWLPAGNSPLDDRIAEVASLLHSDALIRLAGDRWHQLGASKAKALAQPVELSSLEKVWRKVPLTKGAFMYRLDLWNGRDGPQGANLSSTIHVPSEEVDVLVISVSESRALEASGISWDDVLALTEASAKKLGGRAIIASHELLDWAAEKNLEHAGQAAYAACWGIDRSGKNPKYKRLEQASHTLPYCSVACTTWKEAQIPNESSLENTIHLLKDL